MSIQSNQYADFFIGGISGIVSRTLTAPIELHKLHKQNPFMPYASISKTYQVEGIRGLWKGNLVNSIRIFPQMSINYYVYHQSKHKIWNPLIDKKTTKEYKNAFHKEPVSSSPVHLLSGATAAVISTMAIYPLETIRSRLSLQVKNNHYTGLFYSIQKISLRDMYRGLGVSLCGFVPFNALSLTFYNYYKDTFYAKKTESKYVKYSTYLKDDYIHLLAGGLSGVSSITITYPTDLIRKRLQLQNFDVNVPIYKNARQCLKKIYKTEG